MGQALSRVSEASLLQSYHSLICESSGFDQMAKLQSSVRCGAGDLPIPVIGSAVGVDGGGVEQKEGNGSGTSNNGR